MSEDVSYDGAMILGLIGSVIIGAVGAFSYAITPPSLCFHPHVLISPSSPSPTPMQIPERVFFSGGIHTWQTYNNCGPAALSINLSYLGVTKSQKELGDILRPYQHPQGIHDDKSVTLQELADYAKSMGFGAYNRPHGSLDLMRELLALRLPVLVRTLLNLDSDIGHYRVLIGYDRSQHIMYQSDSYQGKHLSFPEDEFLSMWDAYDKEYLVIFPKSRQQDVDTALGSFVDDRVAWSVAENTLEHTFQSHPDDVYTGMNLSVARYHTRDIVGSIQAYESIANRLPPRALWYQLEPILSYKEAGDFPKALKLIDEVISSGDDANAELYQVKGEIALALGNNEEAKRFFQTALRYHTGYAPALDSLRGL